MDLESYYIFFRLLFLLLAVIICCMIGSRDWGRVGVLYVWWMGLEGEGGWVIDCMLGGWWWIGRRWFWEGLVLVAGCGDLEVRLLGLGW